jgi:hypothetical protein
MNNNTNLYKEILDHLYEGVYFVDSSEQSYIGIKLQRELQDMNQVKLLVNIVLQIS